MLLLSADFIQTLQADSPLSYGLLLDVSFITCFLQNVSEYIIITNLKYGYERCVFKQEDEAHFVT